MKVGLKLALAVVGIGVLATVPSWGSAVLVQFGINALILATLAQSWNIIGGYTGYPSFGNSVFYGLGGYGVATAMVQFQLPFEVGLTIGVALAVIFAVLLGLPVLRLRGHYFAIATLGLAEVMTAIVSNLEIAGRNVGLILPLLKGDTPFFELALALLVVTTLTVAWISRSRFGFGLIAIRENEGAADRGGDQGRRVRHPGRDRGAVAQGGRGGEARRSGLPTPRWGGVPRPHRRRPPGRPGC